VYDPSVSFFPGDNNDDNVDDDDDDDNVPENDDI